ncbi:LOW QUALITY PROTEIN: hypothetical protein CVT25_006792 [Psilocybe cyanescens]|uniref:Uncharacterized protein n=1 Tax=Psilocybe cyanescens TaxID=93625 RepID=A0A409WYJ4_PSICY|nr:LOW QUALITY PROTEIN: hypothetical protein CVT25_006792 [Psilocybe cyanescens]
MVYGGTMYLYISKKPANLNHCIVLSAISVLYILCFLDFIVEWYYLDWEVVITGDTRESIFLATVGNGLEWAFVLSGFLENFLLIISDGLLVVLINILVWRCYHVWGESFLAISAPLILLVAEFGLFVVTMVLDVKFGPLTSDANANLGDNIISALTLVSLGTTMITTFIIGYRIHSVSQMHGSPSRKLFNHIVTMIIESAAVYSLVLLLESIMIFVPSTDVPGSLLSEAQYYLETILTVISNQGMAPTILVARIATNNNPTVVSSTITHISGLQFGSQQGSGSSGSGNITRENVNTSVHTDNVDPAPVIKVMRESSAHGIFGEKQPHM